MQCFQELKETRHRHESHLVEVDSGKQVEYDYKLAEALAEIRTQQGEQVDIYKREMENTYMAKVCMGMYISVRFCTNINVF